MNASTLNSVVLSIFLLCPLSALPQSLDWGRSTGSASQEIAYAVAADRDSAVITIGTYALTVDVDPGAGTTTLTSNGSSDVFIQKLDREGNFVWGWGFGGTGADLGLGVVTDAADNIYLTGKVSGTLDLDPTDGVDMVTTANTAADVYVIKLSASGAYLWGRIFGGNGNDQGNDIALDASGNVVTVGLLGTTADLDPGPAVVSAGGNGQEDVFVQKMDPNGTFLWGFGVGGSAADRAYGVAVDASGSILVTGEFRTTVDFDPDAGVESRTSVGGEDIFVMKLSNAGALQWVDAFGGTGSERGRAIAVGPDGGPVLTGRITSVTDMDPGPGVENLNGSGFEDAFMLKLDAAGALDWTFLLASFLNEGFDLAVDLQNNVFATGMFGSLSTLPLDIDPGPGTTNLFSNGASDGFLLSYTATGELRWGIHMGGAQNDFSVGLALSYGGRVVICGDFRQTMDADPGPDVVLLTTAGGQDAFTIQYNKPECTGVFVQARAVLGAAYESGESLMTDHLRLAGLIPLNEPYTAMGFALDAPATTTTAALAWTQTNAIVDWVLVELRDPADPTEVLGRKAALLQRDGNVVAEDGVAPVGFCVADGPYHIALRHRNHLGVMTDEPIALSSTAVTVDFRSIAVHGVEAQRIQDGVPMLWPGNVFHNNEVGYAGADNDRDPILLRIGGVVPTAIVDGYFPEDVNMNGAVQYTGVGNDRDIILQVIGGAVPTDVRTEQLP